MAMRSGKVLGNRTRLISGRVLSLAPHRWYRPHRRTTPDFPRPGWTHSTLDSIGIVAVGTRPRASPGLAYMSIALEEVLVKTLERARLGPGVPGSQIQQLPPHGLDQSRVAEIGQLCGVLGISVRIGFVISTSHLTERNIVQFSVRKYPS